MNVNQNARPTPRDREILVGRLVPGERPVDVTCAMGVSLRTPANRWKRFREGGLAGLRDRSSRPVRGLS